MRLLISPPHFNECIIHLRRPLGCSLLGQVQAKLSHPYSSSDCTILNSRAAEHTGEGNKWGEMFALQLHLKSIRTRGTCCCCHLGNSPTHDNLMWCWAAAAAAAVHRPWSLYLFALHMLETLLHCSPPPGCQLIGSKSKCWQCDLLTTSATDEGQWRRRRAVPMTALHRRREKGKLDHT